MGEKESAKSAYPQSGSTLGQEAIDSTGSRSAEPTQESGNTERDVRRPQLTVTDASHSPVTFPLSSKGPLEYGILTQKIQTSSMRYQKCFICLML